MKLNIRNKLIIFAILAIIVPLGLSAIIILVQLTSATSERSEERIKADARVAKTFFDKEQDKLRAAAQSIAPTLASGRGAPRPAAPAAGAPAPAAGGTATAPAQPSNKATQDLLKAQLETNRVSFVVYLDPKGKVIAQHNGGPTGDGNYFVNNPYFKTVANAAERSAAETASGVAAEPALVLEATGLKDRAAVKTYDQGLFLEAAAPVLSGNDIQGVVLVGQLVNNDNAVEGEKQTSIVNAIKETLYRDQNVRDQAGVIIASSDGANNTIISTNVSGKGGGVVTGEKVQVAGGTYAEPSFGDAQFGDDRYYTSFVPIERVEQQGGAQTVGRIGVAIKQDWFTAIVRRVQLTVGIVSLVALALAIAGAVLAAQRLTRPIEELTEAANRISLGELDVPIAVSTGDEIGTLGESLDRMRISLKQAIERLRKR
jgi:HAMP domain-containing protein